MLDDLEVNEGDGQSLVEVDFVCEMFKEVSDWGRVGYGIWWWFVF